VDNFSGTVRVIPSCRDEAVEIRITDGQSNGSIPYTRNEPGEECTFEIVVDDDQVKSVDLNSSEMGNIDISESGEVTVSIDII